MSEVDNLDVIRSALQKVKEQQENFGYMKRFNTDENWAVTAALEKITPKKPIVFFDQYYACPECEEPLMNIFHTYTDKPLPKSDGLPCCWKCGQKIDWSD